MKTLTLLCFLLTQVGFLLAENSDSKDSLIALESINGEKFQGIIVEEDEKTIILQLKDSSNISLIKEELIGYRTIPTSYLSGYLGFGNNSSLCFGFGFSLYNWSLFIDYMKSESYSSGYRSSTTEDGKNLSILIGWRPHYEYFTLGLYCGLAFQTYNRVDITYNFYWWILYTTNTTSSSSSGTSFMIKGCFLYNPLDWFSVGLNYSYYFKPNLSNSYISLMMAIDLKLAN